jgi:hypothetical protein
MHQHSTVRYEEGDEEYKEQEGDTPHFDTWRNARVWVGLLGWLA